MLAWCGVADPDVIRPVTLDELRDSKQYHKLQQKLEKELDTLNRKHEKVSLVMSMKMAARCSPKIREQSFCFLSRLSMLSV